ncbi:hypothetical protein VDGD_09860 [Verticillium dahliae]|nr:hypothetical protein VDGD_09860 [Verticillium dahliae]
MALLLGFILGLAGLARPDPPPPMSLWQVKPYLDYDDQLYAGWDQIKVVKEVEVYNGQAENRTYAHHPELYAIGDKVFLIYSSAPVDEDSMGQDVWLSTSDDAGLTWTPGTSIMPAALLPNQTELHNFKWWCDRGITQRVWQGLAFVRLDDGELFAIGQSGSRWCPGDGKGGGFRSAGRIAVPISLDGEATADPCWIETNEWTEEQLYPETIYGTEFGMKFCKRACEINKHLVQPADAPAWSPWLYNSRFIAGDGAHRMEENTHAVWFNDTDSPTGGYWQRFWRDISSEPLNTHNVWIEYNEDPQGRDWYPRRKQEQGNRIFQTNIPDGKTKQWHGKLDGSGDRYLLSNPRWNPDKPERQPLTLAISRGDGPSFRAVGVLRTNAPDNWIPDTRGGIKDRAHGYSYPTAIQIGDRLIVSYSENKENIWVSVVDISEFPEDQDKCQK